MLATAKEEIPISAGPDFFPDWYSGRVEDRLSLL